MKMREKKQIKKLPFHQQPLYFTSLKHLSLRKRLFGL